MRCMLSAIVALAVAVLSCDGGRTYNRNILSSDTTLTDSTVTDADTVFVDFHVNLDKGREPGCRACHKPPDGEFWWDGELPIIGPHNGIDLDNPWVCCFCHNPKDWYTQEE